MDSGAAWREWFLKWPKEMPRKGVLVTDFGEQIPFDGFMTTDTLLVVERRTPDTIGARKVILPYARGGDQAHRCAEGESADSGRLRRRPAESGMRK